MPRPPRADEAGGLYHALNRGNLRADIFRKEADFRLCGTDKLPASLVFCVPLAPMRQQGGKW